MRLVMRYELFGLPKANEQYLLDACALLLKNQVADRFLLRFFSSKQKQRVAWATGAVRLCAACCCDLGLRSPCCPGCVLGYVRMDMILR